MKLNIEQGEIKRILEMHSKMKKTLSEQAPELKNTDSNSLRDELEKLVTDNCIPNGKVVEMGGTNPDYKWAVEQESTKTPGKKRYFFKGGIVGEFVNNKWVPNPTPWKCDKQSEQSDIRQAFIAKQLPKGHKVKLTPQEIASNQWKAYIIPGSVQQFPPNGITAYSARTESNKAEAAKTKDEQIDQIIKNINQDLTPQSKSKCKKTLNLYYNLWQTRKNISDIGEAEFNDFKEKTQACVNEYGAKWGGMFSDVEEKVAVLTKIKDGSWKLTSPRFVKL